MTLLQMDVQQVVAELATNIRRKKPTEAAAAFCELWKRTAPYIRRLIVDQEIVPEGLTDIILGETYERAILAVTSFRPLKSVNRDKIRWNVQLWLCDHLRSVVTGWIRVDRRAAAVSSHCETYWTEPMRRGYEKLTLNEKTAVLMFVQGYDLRDGTTSVAIGIVREAAQYLNISMHEVGKTLRKALAKLKQEVLQSVPSNGSAR